MTKKLRHSHIAARAEIDTLAARTRAILSTAEDDLGVYKFFDINISHGDGVSQCIRFASHVGDRMVHLLADDPNDVSDLAAALVFAGIKTQKELSISTDQDGRPLRNVDLLFKFMMEMAHPEKSRTDLIEPSPKQRGRHRSLPTIALH